MSPVTIIYATKYWRAGLFWWVTSSCCSLLNFGAWWTYLRQKSNIGWAPLAFPMFHFNIKCLKIGEEEYATVTQPYLTDCIFRSIKHSCYESLKRSKYRRAGWVQRIEFYFIPQKTHCHITYFWKWKTWRRIHNASEKGWTKGIHIIGIHAELLVSHWTMYQSDFFKRPTESAITLIHWPKIGQPVFTVS